MLLLSFAAETFYFACCCSASCFLISVAESLAVEYERVIIFAADSILKDVAKNNHGASFPRLLNIQKIEKHET